eukprot:1450618-Rhodomonas_salina.1
MDFCSALMQDDGANQYWHLSINEGSDCESGDDAMFCENSYEDAVWQMRASCSDDGSIGSTPVELCECVHATKAPAPAPETGVWEMVVDQAHIESLHADELNFENMMTSPHLC